MNFVLLSLGIYLATLRESDFPPRPDSLSWESLKPRWLIRTNAVDDYQILFRAYNQSRFTLALTNHLSHVQDCQDIINETERRLRLEHEILTSISEAFKPWHSKP